MIKRTNKELLDFIDIKVGDKFKRKDEPNFQVEIVKIEELNEDILKHWTSNILIVHNNLNPNNYYHMTIEEILFRFDEIK